MNDHHTPDPARVRQAHHDLAGVEGVAESDDRFVSATVGHDHSLRELWLDPRALRGRDPEALAEQVLETVRAATEDADRRAFAVAQPFFPPGTGFEDVDLAFDPVLAELDRRAQCALPNRL